jgi:hypothetical protein
MWTAVPIVCGPQVHWGILFALLLYSTAAAVGVGFLLGLGLVVNRAIDHLVDMFDLSLKITDQAVGDVDALRDGDLQMDTRELLHRVHDDVLLPVIEGVIRGQSPRLGRLLFPLYRASIGRVTRYVLKRIHDPESDGESVAPTASAGPDSSPTDSSPTDSSEPDTIGMLERSRDFLRQAHEVVLRRGRQVQNVVTIPLWFAIGLAILVALLPLIGALIYVVVRPFA